MVSSSGIAKSACAWPWAPAGRPSRDSSSANGLRLCVAAVVAGALGSLALTQLLRGMLVNVSRWDPWAYAGAALAMLMVATAALWLPTRRATQIDPATAVLAD